MKILVMRTCGVEDGIDDADFALVELDKNIIDSIRKCLTIAKRVKTEDDSFSTANFRDWNPTFISADTLRSLKLDLPSGWIDADNGNGENAVVDSKREVDALLNGKDTERMDYCCLTASEDSFWWTGNSKYAGSEVTSVAIYEKDFNEKIAPLVS